MRSEVATRIMGLEERGGIVALVVTLLSFRATSSNGVPLPLTPLREESTSIEVRRWSS